MKKILLTGGGTAGHVTPNLALVPKLKNLGYEIRYVGSYNGIEKKLIEEEGIQYYGISSGKFRRNLSAKNLTDPFRVMKGYIDAKKILKEYKPDIVFSKGGFVTVPVVISAGRMKIPVVIHESDLTPGLANKIAIPYATKVCHNFPETSRFLPKGKSVLTGSPLRKEIFEGSKEKGLELCGFWGDKPCIMVIGGSLGAAGVNKAVRLALPALLDKYQVVHICGKDKMDETLNGLEGYRQFEYVKEELKDLFAMSDLIISRAGANAICEIAALKKPSILIPLPKNASRGDQILNADSFKKQGLCEVIEEDSLTIETLCEKIDFVFNNKNVYIEAIEKSGSINGVDSIISLIESLT